MIEERLVRMPVEIQCDHLANTISETQYQQPGAKPRRHHLLRLLIQAGSAQIDDTVSKRERRLTKKLETDQHQDKDSEMQDAAADKDKDAAAASLAANPAMVHTTLQQLPYAQTGSENAAEAAQMQQSMATENVEEHKSINTDNAPTAENGLLVDLDQLCKNLEHCTTEWHTNNQDGEQAMQLWQSYTQLTHDLSLILTEQLQLIMMPTQKTQLRRDYCTGKRLNTKRIIPYIASEFCKGNIWLCHTKTTRREYQVMVSVDNSKYMAQSTQAVKLAYKPLALVTTALNQFEVSLLHPFGSPFDSDAGACALSRFSFDNDKADAAQLMDASLQLFNVAAHSGSGNSADLWNLQFVIFDDVCQNHPRLLRQARTAVDMGIMTVFIVLDHSAIATSAAAGTMNPEKDSIVNTQQVLFVMGPSGKMEMMVKQYIDTSPLKYYVVLHNILDLLAVLAKTLRQYFSLVASD
ncbi:AAA ATPase midasin [Kickxella alabastrina]|uniref:AAA ATPase midasin n=1 Tax=Kickxella alabastrina TaxID=61397 RepID=A0ACC1IJ71_9FUNG|nr:AAA ATPase midasin [Kickxella alabastrina]